MQFYNKVDKEFIKKAIKTDRRLCGYPDISAKLDDPDLIYQNYVKSLAQLHFELKAVNHDILRCSESKEKLSQLNEKGRMIVRIIREEMEKLAIYAKEARQPKYDNEVETQRILLIGLLQEFKDSNIRSLFVIEKAERKDLFMPSEDGTVGKIRLRKLKVDSDGLIQISTDVTDQLISISRQLANTTQRSQETLDNLVSSSSTVHGTQNELQNTAGSISQSSKLLNKYGRREFTDKVIMIFAFLFFLAVCVYIVQKRLF